MILYDAVKPGSVRRTADGYLVADARVARTGIQEYNGSELGMPETPVVKLYRPEDVVFNADSMASYAHRPMTSDHPNERVTSKNWRKVAVGNTGGDVMRDGEYIRVPLCVMDAAAIEEYEGGKRELSMGYDVSVDFTPGVTPNGQAYDAVVTKLKMNHLALVDRARGGDALRIGDDHSNRGNSDMTDVKTVTVLVDSLSVITTEAGAQALSKLQGQLSDASKANEKLANDHKTALEAKDKAIAKAEAERDTLKGQVMTDAQLDAKVKERGDLVAVAMAIVDGEYAGKSAADIRKAVVTAKLGDAAVKDKSDAYIEARFEILAEDAKKDPVRGALNDSRRNSPPAGDNGQDGYEKRLNDAWKGTTHQQKGA